MPAFLLYAQDFIADPKVAVMTTEEVGAYFLLLCFNWVDGHLPDDDKKLATLSRTHAKWKNVKEVVKSRFIPLKHPKHGDILYNKRLFEERAKALKKRIVRQEAACKRWGKHYANASAKDEQCISISSSISNSITPPPTTPRGGDAIVDVILKRVKRELDSDDFAVTGRVIEFLTTDLRSKKRSPKKTVENMARKLEKKPALQIARAAYSFEETGCYERKLRFNYFWAIVTKSAESWMIEFRAAKDKVRFELDERSGQ